MIREFKQKYLIDKVIIPDVRLRAQTFFLKYFSIYIIGSIDSVKTSFVNRGKKLTISF